jgi:hypothetical protein
MYVLVFIRNDTGILKSIYMAQRLSAEAAKKKAARDLAYAKTPDRRAKKADAQRRRRADPKGSVGKDWDHKNQRWESPAQNRGNDGLGTKSESGKKYKTK